MDGRGVRGSGRGRGEWYMYVCNEQYQNKCLAQHSALQTANVKPTTCVSCITYHNLHRYVLSRLESTKTMLIHVQTCIAPGAN